MIVLAKSSIFEFPAAVYVSKKNMLIYIYIYGSPKSIIFEIAKKYIYIVVPPKFFACGGPKIVFLMFLKQKTRLRHRRKVF